jgi:four helix bundle protein
MGYYKELLAFKKAYELAMLIFQVSKKFPPEERYSLTDQIRRSSRSVCTNLAESYKRRRYKDYFVSKLNDSETENTETEVWIYFSRDCGYITVEESEKLLFLNDEAGKLIWHMIHNLKNTCSLTPDS